MDILYALSSDIFSKEKISQYRNSMSMNGHRIALKD